MNSSLMSLYASPCRANIQTHSVQFPVEYILETKPYIEYLRNTQRRSIKDDFYISHISVCTMNKWSSCIHINMKHNTDIVFLDIVRHLTVMRAHEHKPSYIVSMGRTITNQNIKVMSLTTKRYSFRWNLEY